MPEALAAKLLFALDTVTIEQTGENCYQLLDTPPDWFNELNLFENLDGSNFAVADELSFLANFAIDAAEFWKKAAPGQILWSGVWDDTVESGKSCQLEVGAILLEDRKILIIRLLGHSILAEQDVLQKAREELLAFEDLSRTEQDLQKYKEQLEKEVQKRTAELTKTLAGVQQAMAKTLEIRDPYTAGHQRRVSQLACAIAKEMKQPRELIKGLNVAGILHDIGKIQIPTEILSKPGRLTALEFDVIKSHAEAGYEILKEIDFPWPIAQIVVQHHEKIDGSGYPKGLTDKDILIEAKILAVADVVEAMSSHRPYRPGLGIDVAMEEISNKSGTHYDRKVVNACLKVIKEKGFKFE